jgi:hypothetical protein
LLGSENGPFEQKLLDNLLLLRILQEYGKGDGFIYRVDRPLLAECCRSRMTVIDPKRTFVNVWLRGGL